MKRPFSRLGVGLALWFGAAAATGCTPSNKVKSGQPVLLSFSVVGADGQAAVLKDEAGAPVAGPPMATFFAIFDRLLDASAIEKLEDGGPVAMAGVSSIETPAAAVASSVLYVPNGDAKFFLGNAPGPSITVMPDPEMGLPCDTMVTVSLSPDHVRSHDQTMPFMASGDIEYPLSYLTEPFGVAIDVPAPPEDPDGGMTVAPPVDPTFVANVTFNNLTPDTTMDLITTTVTVAGAPVAGVVAEVARAADSMNAWTVSPPMAGWPAGAVVTVSVAGTASDFYMKTLGNPATATFTVKP